MKYIPEKLFENEVLGRCSYLTVNVTVPYG